MGVYKFSVLISSYYKDSPLFLERALESLKDQTLQASEIVFVEDGKLTRELYDVLDRYASLLPIKRLSFDENKGLGNALKIGLENCTNDIVLRMDTDDICDRERFEKQVTFLQNNKDIDILGTWVKDIDNNGKIIGERIFPTNHVDLLKVIWACPLAHPTIAFRKESIISIGSYNTGIKRRQDYDLWLRAATKGLRFGNIPEFLLYYRFTDDYYKKNNLKVAWEQGMMGYNGLRDLKVKSFFPYIGVFSPVIRALMPKFFAKLFHKLTNRLDPRKKIARTL